MGYSPGDHPRVGRDLATEPHQQQSCQQVQVNIVWPQPLIPPRGGQHGPDGSKRYMVLRSWRRVCGLQDTVLFFWLWITFPFCAKELLVGQATVPRMHPY